MSKAFLSAAPNRRDGLDFWRRPWVKNVLPLLTSLALHASFAAALLLAYSAGCKIAENRQAETQVSVPTSDLVEVGPAAGGGGAASGRERVNGQRIDVGPTVFRE